MINYLQALLEQRYEFRYNSVWGVTEYCSKGTQQFKQLGKRERNTILREVRNLMPTCSAQQLNELLDSNFCEELNPFEQYFNSLPQWDDIDHITLLSRTVATDDDKLWQTVLRKYLCATVNCLLKTDFTNQHMLVLVGKQGIGKSTWQMRLLPDALKRYVHIGPIDPDNKDDVRKLSQCMFIILDELDAMGRSNAARLKELISRPEINQRRPYNIENEVLPRRASFMASLNTSQFLYDQTGNRRILTFIASAIDLDVKIDMDQLYAQVYSMVKAGEECTFTLDEAQKINERNQSYLSLSPLEAEIDEHFEQGAKGEDRFWRASDVAEVIKRSLKVKQVNHSFITQVGGALSKRFRQERRGDQRGYYLRLRTPYSKGAVPSVQAECSSGKG